VNSILFAVTPYLINGEKLTEKVRTFGGRISLVKKNVIGYSNLDGFGRFCFHSQVISACFTCWELTKRNFIISLSYLRRVLIMMREKHLY